MDSKIHIKTKCEKQTHHHCLFYRKMARVTRQCSVSSSNVVSLLEQNGYQKIYPVIFERLLNEKRLIIIIGAFSVTVDRRLKIGRSLHMHTKKLERL